MGLLSGLVAGGLGVIPRPNIHLSWTIPALAPGRYVPQASLDSGEEVALIYVGSSGCMWSNHRDLPDIVRSLKREFLDRTRDAGKGFSAVGIAKDRSAVAGIAHLNDFGPFDEMLTGRGWANSGVRKYIFGHLPGPASTPQILVVSQTLTNAGGQVSIGNEVVLTRKVGLEEIRTWAELGAPVDLQLAVRMTK